MLLPRVFSCHRHPISKTNPRKNVFCKGFNGADLIITSLLPFSEGDKSRQIAVPQRSANTPSPATELIPFCPLVSFVTVPGLAGRSSSHLKGLIASKAPRGDRSLRRDVPFPMLKYLLRTFVSAHVFLIICCHSHYRDSPRTTSRVRSQIPGSNNTLLYIDKSIDFKNTLPPGLFFNQWKSVTPK